MTRTTIVVSLSVGTAFLFALAITVLSVAIVAGGHASNPLVPFNLWSRAVPKPPTFTPKAGAIGELNRLKNDIQYGPVNLDAAKQIKNGLFDRIRANRQARQAGPCNQQTVTRSVSEGPKPIAVTTACHFPAYQIIDPSDCNASQILADSRARGVTLLTQSIGVPQSIGVEMPSVVPLAQLMADRPSDRPVTPSNCTTCKADPRNAVKTGCFICSNCRRSQVGDWHTEWNEAGQPITFLCEKCFTLMTPDQRETAYRGYLARQSKSVGITGLMHQELSK